VREREPPVLKVKRERDASAEYVAQLVTRA
jgi:hypothetical protein